VFWNNQWEEYGIQNSQKILRQINSYIKDNNISKADLFVRSKKAESGEIAILNIERMNLSFFPGVTLSRINCGTADVVSDEYLEKTLDENGHVYFLHWKNESQQTEFRFLNGESAPIHEAGEGARFDISDEKKAIEFLDFFCTFVESDEGLSLVSNIEATRFHLDESDPESDFKKTRSEEQDLEEKNKLKVLDSPPEILGPIVDSDLKPEQSFSWTFENVMILYGDGLFRATMKVGPGTAIEMIDDEPIESSVQIRSYNLYPWEWNKIIHALIRQKHPEFVTEKELKERIWEQEKNTESNRILLQNIEATEMLDLCGFKISKRIEATGLVVDGDLLIEEAAFDRSIDLSHSRIKGLLSLRNTNVGGSVRLANATIIGSQNESSPISLNLDGIDIRRNLRISELKLTGPLFMRHARLGGGVFACGTEIEQPEDDLGLSLLKMDHSRIDGSLDFYEPSIRPGEKNKFSSDTKVTIEGNIDLKNMQVDGFLNFESAKIDGAVNFNSSIVNGLVNFEKSEIEGSLSACLATIKDKFSARRCEVGEDFDISGAEIRSDVGLEGANIKGIFRFTTGHVGRINFGLIGYNYSDLGVRPQIAYASSMVGGIYIHNACINGDLNLNSILIGGGVNESGSDHYGKIVISPAVIKGDLKFWNRDSVKKIKDDVKGQNLFESGLCLEDAEWYFHGDNPGPRNIRDITLSSFANVPRGIDCRFIEIGCDLYLANIESNEAIDFSNSNIGGSIHSTPRMDVGNYVDRGEDPDSKNKNNDHFLKVKRLVLNSMTCGGSIDLTGLKTAWPNDEESFRSAIENADLSIVNSKISGDVFLYKEIPLNAEPCIGKSTKSGDVSIHKEFSLTADPSVEVSEVSGDVSLHKDFSLSADSSIGNSNISENDLSDKALPSKKEYQAFITGKFDFTSSCAAHLTISGETFDHAKAETFRKKYTDLCNEELDQDDAWVIFDRATISRVSIQHPLPDRIDLSHISIDRWHVDNNKDLLCLVESSRPFQKNTYRIIENSLNNMGEEKIANEVYVAMHRREIKEGKNNTPDTFLRRMTKAAGALIERIFNIVLLPIKVLVLSPLRPMARKIWPFLFDSLLGYGTAPFRLLIPISIFFAISVYIFSNPQNIQPSLQYIGTGANTPIHGQPPKNWGMPNSIWMTIRYHVPVIGLTVDDEWEASNTEIMNAWGLQTITPEKWAGAMSILNWIMWPLLIGFAFRKLLRNQ